MLFRKQKKSKGIRKYYTKEHQQKSKINQKGLETSTSKIINRKAK
jgi:hypothetical protein